jgi:hypothetical protein
MTLRQKVASTSQPSSVPIILTTALIEDCERNLLFLNISLKKRALQIGLPRYIDGPMKIQMASGFI